MLVQLEDGNLKDVKITEVTPDNYIIPEGEEGDYHCVIEVKKFNPETGERLSKPRIQKFNKRIFDSIMRKQLKLQGYTVTILHDPTEWLAKQEAEEKQMKARTKKAIEEAKKREFDEAVAKAVAEALANVKQSKGKIDNANKRTTNR